MQIEAACSCKTDLNMKCCTKSQNGKSIKIQEPEKMRCCLLLLFCASILFRDLDAYENGTKTTMMHDFLCFLIFIFYLFSSYRRRLPIHESTNRLMKEFATCPWVSLGFLITTLCSPSHV